LGGEIEMRSEPHFNGNDGYHTEASGYHTTSIPKPVIDHLGKGKEVVATTYKIRGTSMEISTASGG